MMLMLASGTACAIDSAKLPNPSPKSAISRTPAQLKYLAIDARCPEETGATWVNIPFISHTGYESKPPIACASSGRALSRPSSRHTRSISFQTHSTGARARGRPAR